MFLPRSVSLLRLAVSGRRPDPLDPAFLQALQRRRFTPLAEDSAEPEAAGWTSFGNFLDTALQLDELLLGQHLRLGLRVDRKALPPALVKAHVELEKKALRQAGNGAPGRKELEQIKAGVEELLRPQVQIKTQFIRGVWGTKRKTLWLLSVSEAAAERFSAEFQKTFERKLTPLGPAALLRRLELPSDLLGKLELIEPADLRPTR